jgi:hypothetical protein
MRRIIVAVLAVAVALPPAGAVAGKGNKGKGKKDDSDQRDANVSVTVRFGERDREAVSGYFVEAHGRGHCPPGLAKKNNGCLPPGQAKKSYTIGQSLPRTVVIHELPREISVRLGPPPSGYRYGIVDGDLVKLAIGTALVVDAISGLVE